MNKFKINGYHVLLFTIFAVMVCLIVYIITSPYKREDFLIANPHYIVNGENYLRKDQVTEDPHTGYIKIDKSKRSIGEKYDKLISDGKILTLDEFAENISNYYNALITVLSALFVLFSIVVYIYFAHRTKQEEDALSAKLEDRIMERLEQELRDSIEIRNSFLGSFKTELEEKYALRSSFDDQGEIVEGLCQRVEELEEMKNEEESASSSVE